MGGLKKGRERIALYAIIIAAAIVVPSVVVYENYNSSPFNSVLWEMPAISNVTSAISSNNTFFFSNFTSAETSGGNVSTSIWITAVNITSGKLLWNSSIIQTSGIDPLMITSQLNAPKMWIEKDTLYAVVYNSTDMLEIHYFEIYAFNSTSGEELAHQKLDFYWMNSNVTQLYAPWVIPTSDGMFLSFITQYVPWTGPSGSINATFHTVHYGIQGNSLETVDVSNCSVPGTISWGDRFMQVASSSGYAAFTFSYDNETLIENLADGSYQIVHSYLRGLSEIGNEFYASEQQNHTVSVLLVNTASGDITKVFSFSNMHLGNNQSTEYAMYVLSNSRFSFVIQGDLLLPSSPEYPYVTFLGFSSNGTMLWNKSVKADQYGTFTQVNNLGSNKTMLSTQTGAYVPRGTYTAEFLLIDFQTGKTLWSNSYGYSTDERNSPWNIFHHKAYFGELATQNGYFVFVFGSQIACSQVNGLLT